MKIAQVAPLWERVPPTKYGAVESIVSDLADELVRRGHDVTLFAAGNSQTLGGLESIHPLPLNHDLSIKEPEIYRYLQMSRVLETASSFDIIHSHIHSHTGCLGLPFLSMSPTPVVHTIHCFFNPDNGRLFRRFASERFVSISDDQRRRLPELDYVATIHHGIDVDRFPFREEPDTPNYLAFLGRLRPDKGPHVAIEVARRAGLVLKIAGRVKNADRDYFNATVRPHLDDQECQFLGELGFHEKVRLLGGAMATIMPTELPEPFGLVTIESMACGTPVVVTATGAAAELVAAGRTGYIATSVDEMVELVGQAGRISRSACRQHVRGRFSLTGMVDAYEASYREILQRGAVHARLGDLAPISASDGLRSHPLS